MKPLVCLAALLMGVQGASARESPPEPPYEKVGSTVLTSTNTGWDYARFEPGSPRLFIARLKDGLTVYDVDRGQALATIEDSFGANGPILLPSYGRGYVAMSDGSLLCFDLNTLKTISRKKLTSDGGLNSGFLDPTTGELHVITGTRPAETTWFSIDPATGKLLRATRFAFRKMDDPAADGKGHLYAPVRLDNLVLKLDSRTLEERARWDVGCNVSKLKYLAATNRLLGACVGDRPSVFLLDAATGSIVSRAPIGKGLDALVYDAEREQIVSSNSDGTMTVLQREGDDLRVVATVRTEFGARMMDIDHRTGRLYLVNAASTEFPGGDGGASVTRYHNDSFHVDAWRPN